MNNHSYNFCFYCGKKTNVVYKDIRKSLNGKMITIKNVPLYHCVGCREVFYPDFVINLLNNIAKINEFAKNTVFDFDSIYKSIFGSDC